MISKLQPFEPSESEDFDSTLPLLAVGRCVSHFFAKNKGGTYADFHVTLLAEASKLFDDIQDGIIYEETIQHPLYEFATSVVVEGGAKTRFIDIVDECANTSFKRVTRFKADDENDTDSNISVALNGNLFPELRGQMNKIRGRINALNNTVS